MEYVVWLFVAFAIGCVFLSLRGGNLRGRYRDAWRTGWAKDAQRFTAHPWRRSFFLGAFAGVVAGASVGLFWTDGGARIWLVFIGVAIPGVFAYRYWLGPYTCRKYLEPSSPA